MSSQPHYPMFDVMAEADSWDEHTRSIVTARLVRESSYSFLTLEEAETLRAVCTRLVADERAEIIQYVIGHFDDTLSANKGESQRKPGVAPADQLIRSGLHHMEQASITMYSKPYYQLDETRQQQLLENLSRGDAEPIAMWKQVPQKELFQKLLSMTLDAYCSHPALWSDIGYAGPAYPRGYVRTHPGQWDPWEAHREDET